MITAGAREFGKDPHDVSALQTQQEQTNHRHYTDVPNHNPCHPVLLKILPDSLVFAHTHVSLSSAIQIFTGGEINKCPQSNKWDQVCGLAHEELETYQNMRRNG
jgi:hypothetical protein